MEETKMMKKFQLMLVGLAAVGALVFVTDMKETNSKASIETTYLIETFSHGKGH